MDEAIKIKHKETSKEKADKKKKSGNVYFSAVSPLDVALSIRHLAIMLKSGMDISAALQVLKSQASDARLQQAFEEIYTDVQGGLSMAKAMDKHKKIFPHIIRSVVDVGEQGATLEKNLLFLAEFLKQSYELNRKVKGALVYPLIVLGLTVVEMTGVVFYILPKLEGLFSSFENTPAMAAAILAIAAFIRGNVLLIGGILLAVIILLNLFFRTKVGIRVKEYLALNFPIIKNLNRQHILTSFSRTLSILLESGIPISSAIEISANTVGNGIYGDILKKVHEQVKSGQNLSTSLEEHKKYFPVTFIKMVGVGEETGTLEDNLMFLHDFYLEEVQEMSTNLTTLLEPILLVFIGAMIALLALTIISPIYQLTGSINGA